MFTGVNLSRSGVALRSASSSTAWRGGQPFDGRVLHGEFVGPDLDARLNGFGAQREDVFVELDGRSSLVARS
jgi:hypothetical protein